MPGHNSSPNRCLLCSRAYKSLVGCKEDTTSWQMFASLLSKWVCIFMFSWTAFIKVCMSGMLVCRGGSDTLNKACLETTFEIIGARRGKQCIFKMKERGEQLNWMNWATVNKKIHKHIQGIHISVVIQVSACLLPTWDQYTHFFTWTGIQTNTHILWSSSCGDKSRWWGGSVKQRDTQTHLSLYLPQLWEW